MCFLPEVVSCNLCGNGDVLALPKRMHALDLPPGVEVVKCTKCGLMFMSPRPSQDEFERFYQSDEVYAVDAYVRRAERRRDFYLARLAQIHSVVGTRARFLEIGCATGHFLKLARDSGMDVSGTEISRPFTEYASGIFGLDVRTVRNLVDAKFPSQSFDMVYASHVFEHLLDPLASIREVARILKDDGLLLIEVPNQFDSLRAVLRRWIVALSTPSAKGLLYHDPISSLHHVFFFTAETLQRVVQKAGFAILKVRTYENHHRQVIGDDPVGGYWLTEMMHRAGALCGLGPVIVLWAKKL